MAEFEDDDIDKMFEELISSDDMDVSKEPRIDAIISIEKVSLESIVKELTFIYQSLSQSVIHVGELMLGLISTDKYELNDEVRDILGNMYRLSEDLDDYMIDLLISESEEKKDQEDNGE
jgi:hypothetical protein